MLGMHSHCGQSWCPHCLCMCKNHSKSGRCTTFVQLIRCSCQYRKVQQHMVSFLQGMPMWLFNTVDSKTASADLLLLLPLPSDPDHMLLVYGFGLCQLPHISCLHLSLVSLPPVCVYQHDRYQHGRHPVNHDMHTAGCSALAES